MDRRKTGEVNQKIFSLAIVGQCYHLLRWGKSNLGRSHYSCFRHADLVTTLNRYLSRDVIAGDWDSESISEEMFESLVHRHFAFLFKYWDWMRECRQIGKGSPRLCPENWQHLAEGSKMPDEPVWEGLTARGGLGYMLSWNPGGNASERKEWVTSSHVSGLLDIVVGSGNIESMVILTGWFSVCVCVLGRGL